MPVQKGFIFSDSLAPQILDRWIQEVTDAVNLTRIEANAGVATDLSAVESRLDALEYVPVEIATFTGGSSNEKGATVTSVSLVWTYNGTPSSQSLTDATLVPADRAKAFTGLSLTSNKTYTLTATDSEGGTDTATTTVAFYSKRHWGASADDSLTSAEILTLASSELSSSRAQTRTFSCVGGKYIWFAWPTTFGTPIFTINGLVDNSFIQASVSHTNASGYTCAYTTWRSLNLLNGSSISVVVS